MTKIDNTAHAQQLAQQLIEQGKLSEAEAKVAIETGTVLAKGDLTHAQRDTYEPMAAALSSLGGPTFEVFQAAYGKPLNAASAKLDELWASLAVEQYRGLFELPKAPTRAQQDWLDARSELWVLRQERERLVEAPPGEWKDQARNDRRADVEDAMVALVGTENQPGRLATLARAALEDMPPTMKLGSDTLPAIRAAMQMRVDARADADLGSFGYERYDTVRGGFCMPGDVSYGRVVQDEHKGDPYAIPVGDAVGLGEHKSTPQVVEGAVRRGDARAVGRCTIECYPAGYDDSGVPARFDARFLLGDEATGQVRHCSFERQADGTWRAQSDEVDGTVSFDPYGDVEHLDLTVKTHGSPIHFSA